MEQQIKKFLSIGSCCELFTLIDSIVLRDFNREYIIQQYCNPGFHQDLHFYPEYFPGVQNCCSGWFLVDGEHDFQRLEFINHDPGINLGYQGIMLSEKTSSDLINNFGTTSPIENKGDAGKIIIFNGTVPHRATNSNLGARRSVDFRFILFDSPSARKAYICSRLNEFLIYKQNEIQPE